jgi:acyl transferase domain-containing protein/NAD(P)-dependent dehydrogenase (short-subunit alcohol dehydrogenase family)/acyl carrier protein
MSLPMPSSISVVSDDVPPTIGRPVPASTPAEDRDIAIVGMSCRFPGANNYDEFWANLVNATGNVGEVPGERWDWTKYYGDPASGNKTNSKWGGYLENVDRFDASFFGISPREAICMDPQQRIILELAWQCIEDAGHKPKALAGTDVGVFVATSSMEYKTLRERFGPSLEGHHATGLAMSAIANRISYFFDFHGPSIALDTACSGSLVAMQAAINAIRNGECSAALVGAISVMATPDTYMAFGKVGMLSSTGACHTFDERADGYVRGEGGGLVYLKPLSAARADGDRILGVVKGISTNHGGRARSLTAPNVRMQSKAIATALRQSGISPSTISYVETHGTGTPLGDPIEIHGLVRAFSQSAAEGEQLSTGYCALGALKASIGHLESAAGVAGVIKVLLAMRFRSIPQNLNFTNLNPRISLENTPFYIADRLTEWKNLVGDDGAEIPLRAGVSSFGFGGVNGHVVIEQAPRMPVAAGHDAAPRQLLAMSAASGQSLLALKARYADLLSQPGCDFAGLCRQANTTRSFHALRFAHSASSAQEMAAALTAENAAPGEAKESAQGGRAQYKAPVVGFMFTGQGAQHVGMGLDLFENHPAFRAAFEACDRVLAPLLGVSIIDVCHSDANGDLGRTRLTQPALFAFEYALAQMWKAHGIVPAAVIGHSVGEIAAACVAGVLSLEDAAVLVSARGRLMDAVPTDGAMATIHACERQVREWIALLGNLVDVAAVNAPQLTVVSGAVSEVDRVLAHAAQCGFEGVKLHVAQAFHSRLMEPVLEAFTGAIAALPMNEPVLPFFSNVTGALAAPGQLTPSYWVEHIRKPVLFGAGIEQMRLSGVDVFVEIGPASVLTAIGRRCCAGEARWVATLQREGSAYQHVLAALGELFRLGMEVDFAPLYASLPQAFVQLPAYPFSGNAYWFRNDGAECQDRRLVDLLLPAGVSLLGSRVQLAGSPDHVYMSAYPNEASAYLEDHRVRGDVVMPAASYIEMAFAAWRRSAPQTGDTGVLGIDGLRLHTMVRLQSGVALQTILRAPQPGSSERGFEVWFARQPEPHTGAVQPEVSPLAWDLAASGRVGPRVASARGAARIVQVDALTVDTDAMYADMAAFGLEYGTAFRALRSLEVAGEVAQGRIVLAPVVRREAGEPVHSTLVDAVFQSAYPLLARHVAPAHTYVPVAIDDMAVEGCLPDSFTVQARMVPSPTGAATLRCEFALFDEDGGSIGSVGALTLQQLAQPGNGAAPAPDSGWLYQSAWTCREDASPTPTPSTRGQGATIVVYGAAGRALAELMAASINSKVVYIDFDARAPSEPAPSGDYHAFDLDAPTALADLLGRYRNIDAVYFFGGFTLPVDGISEDERSATQAAQKQGSVAFFHLAKCLLTQEELRPLQLKVIGNFNETVMPGEAVLPWGAGTAGLAAVFCRENPAVELVAIDLDLKRDDLADANRMAATVSRILAEPSAPGGRSCAYRRGARYAREFEPVTAADGGSGGFRTGGVYLILGGAGGIGLCLARYLAERYAARVVLVGRSALSPERELEISAIGNAPGSVVYARADGTDIDAMSEVVATARTRFGRIDGAVHSAIVLRDSLLANMDAAAFSEAMQPKVDATLVLAKALRGAPLDFLMFFSSAVSMWPTVGQANYVAGCAFQDAYAAHMRQHCTFPVKVINWGRWSGVGVATSEKYSQQFDAQGVFSIDPAEGLAAIETVLRAPAGQVLALKAEPSLLAALGVRPEFLITAAARPAVPGRMTVVAERLSPGDIEALADAGDQGALQSGLYTYLVEELSEVLRVAPGAFDPAQGDLRQSYLSELGMDSLTALDLRTRLRKHLQVDIPIEFLLGGARIQAVFDSIYEQILVRRLMHVAQDGDAGQNEDDGVGADMETMVI